MIRRRLALPGAPKLGDPPPLAGPRQPPPSKPPPPKAATPKPPIEEPGDVRLATFAQRARETLVLAWCEEGRYLRIRRGHLDGAGRLRVHRLRRFGIPAEELPKLAEAVAEALALAAVGAQTLAGTGEPQNGRANSNAGPLSDG